MKRTYLILGIILMALATLLLVAYDLFKPKPENPYEYSVAEYAQVADSLVSHMESRQIVLRSGDPKGMAFADGKIYLLIDSMLQIVLPEGKELFRTNLGETPTCISISKSMQVLIGFENHLCLYSMDGRLLKRSALSENKSLYTAVAATNTSIFVADAAEKEVVIYDFDLQKKGSFKGESGVSDQHGFIIPSLHFDLSVNPDGALWVVNPGLHALQNYTESGKLREQWSKTSFTSVGFSGCCNPFQIAFLSDGSFVTSEKGMVRIKIHKPSGEFASVVAPPTSFKNGHKAPVLAVDENDQILALDLDRKMIRIFTPKNP